MENEFLDPNKEKYRDDELLSAIGPILTAQCYWKKISDFRGVEIEVGMALVDANKNHAGDVVRLSKKKDKCLVKLLKPVSIFTLFVAGISLDTIEFERD